MNVGPVPCGSAADRPTGLGQDAALAPLVDGDASNAEQLGDLGQSYGLALVHEKDCTESLDTRLVRTDNQYMTTTGDSTLTAPCGCTYRGRVYSLAGCTVINTETTTGRDQMRHAMAAQKRAGRQPTVGTQVTFAENGERASTLGVVTRVWDNGKYVTVVSDGRTFVRLIERVTLCG